MARRAVWIFDHEPLLRLGVFSSVLGLMALWEALAPRRQHTAAKTLRRLSNLGLAALNTFIVRVAAPIGAVGMGWIAQERGWGLFNNLTIPRLLAVLLSVVALDFVIYLQHVLFHAVPLLWRLHMVHHADPDFDVTTGVRFHTIEILVSLGIKMAAIVLLGAPALSVFVFEVLLNASSLFSHGNVRLPTWIDGALRWVIVTPDMHRVHHSVNPVETNSNFGFNLSWWDYFLGTYCRQPAAGHDGMTIGLAQFRDERVERLHWMMALPFLGRIGDYALNRSGTKKSVSHLARPKKGTGPDNGTGYY
jgi:sterol desaturase/sphingolipid hydroxylase (fatty acid hydroxylase superfamily)